MSSNKETRALRKRANSEEGGTKVKTSGKKAKGAADESSTQALHSPSSLLSAIPEALSTPMEPSASQEAGAMTAQSGSLAQSGAAREGSAHRGDGGAREGSAHRAQGNDGDQHAEAVELRQKLQEKYTQLFRALEHRNEMEDRLDDATEEERPQAEQDFLAAKATYAKLQRRVTMLEDLSKKLLPAGGSNDSTVAPPSMSMAQTGPSTAVEADTSSAQVEVLGVMHPGVLKAEDVDNRSRVQVHQQNVQAYCMHKSVTLMLDNLLTRDAQIKLLSMAKFGDMLGDDTKDWTFETLKAQFQADYKAFYTTWIALISTKKQSKMGLERFQHGLETQLKTHINNLSWDNTHTKEAFCLYLDKLYDTSDLDNTQAYDELTKKLLYLLKHHKVEGSDKHPSVIYIKAIVQDYERLPQQATTLRDFLNSIQQLIKHHTDRELNLLRYRPDPQSDAAKKPKFDNKRDTTNKSQTEGKKASTPKDAVTTAKGKSSNEKWAIDRNPDGCNHCGCTNHFNNECYFGHHPQYNKDHSKKFLKSSNGEYWHRKTNENRLSMKTVDGKSLKKDA